MSKITVVTEGPHDAALIEVLLNAPSDHSNVKFVAAGGWSSADSLSRSLLVHDTTNVALIVDADSIDPIVAEERKRFLSRSLAGVPSSRPWKVFVVTPEIQALLFADREVVEGLVGHPISDTEFVSGSFEPKKVLHRLLGERELERAYSTALRKLDLVRLREAPPIRELRDFIRGSSAGSGSGGIRSAHHRSPKPASRSAPVAASD